MPCLTGDSITSLSCQDSTHYYCNLTDHMCYSRVEDNSQCQDDSVCNINSICSGNVCVPSGSSNNSSIDAGKVATIVGPILGALLLFAILFLFFCCRRRKKRRENNNVGSMDDNSYPFAARPNSFSSSTPPPVPTIPLARNSPENNKLENQTNSSMTWNQTSSSTIWNQANTNQTNTTTTTYLSGTSTFNDVASEQSTENVRLSKFMYISNALNNGNNDLRDSNSSSSSEKIDSRTGTPIRPFVVNGISSEMNSPTLPLEDLTDRGSTISYFANNSNRDSDVLPTMDQDEFGKSPESVYLGLEFTQPETRPSKGRYTMGSMYSTYSTYSQDYSNYPASPSTFNILRGVQSSVTTGKIDHSRLRNDSFSTVTTQTISQTYDDSRSSYIQLNAPIFSNFNNNGSGSNSLTNTPTHEYSDSTYSTASSLNSNSNSTSSSDHTVTQKNMYSTNRSDQTRKYGNRC
ncbi:1578_t:CDS:2 [Dentiscutata heterogama]|uniref:1578_t:CDS:1 n=1 Tax=Dentiscutata heterogama TaxID=1316150 RepID=A0ACA9KNM0_9GLOM|nr:1578_t:CDS:2 [Dentiscutata heterogama]